MNQPERLLSKLVLNERVTVLNVSSRVSTIYSDSIPCFRFPSKHKERYQMLAFMDSLQFDLVNIRSSYISDGVGDK